MRLFRATEKATFITLVVLLMTPYSSNADWVKVGKRDKGITYYVNFEKIKKNNGYVYWWQLIDKEYGDPSIKLYIQADCKKFRVKVMSVYSYKGPMGQGGVSSSNPPKNWAYPRPNTPGENSLEDVCAYAAKL